MTNKSTSLEDDEISKVFRDPAKITKAIQAGIKAALLKHKQAGNPICGLDKNNKIVWIAPENINIKSIKERE